MKFRYQVGTLTTASKVRPYDQYDQSLKLYNFEGRWEDR